MRRDDGQTLDAQLAGWDPTTSLAVLRVAGLGVGAIAPSTVTARVGHLALAVARSWSNAVTASAGIVSVIGGPLPTGRRRAIDQVIRTSAPMHDGFAGGAFLDAGGGLIGIATAAAIRGLGVVIPASIAWKTAATILEHGQLKRGYLGIAGQPVRLPEGQQGSGGNIGREEALLVVGVTPGSPAAAAGILVGDVLLGVRRPAGRVAGGSARSARRRSRRPPGLAARAARRRRHRVEGHRGRTSGTLMRVVLVGSPSDRARLRAGLNGSIDVVAEFASLAAAERADVDADAVMIAERRERSSSSSSQGVLRRATNSTTTTCDSRSR